MSYIARRLLLIIECVFGLLQITSLIIWVHTGNDIFHNLSLVFLSMVFIIMIIIVATT